MMASSTVVVVLLLVMATFGEGARIKKREKTAEEQVATLSQKAEEKAVTPKIAKDAAQCKVICQRFGMKALGPDFAKLNPITCCQHCDTVFKSGSLASGSLLSAQSSATKAGTASSNLDGTVQKKGEPACMESDFTLTLYGHPHEFALPTGTAGATNAQSCAAFEDKNGLGKGEVNFECKGEKWAYVSHTCQSSKGPMCRGTRFTVTGMDGKGVTLHLKESHPGFVEASCADGFEGEVKSPHDGTVHFLCNSHGVWEHKSGFCRMQMFSRMVADAAGPGPMQMMPDADVQMMPHPDPS